MNEQVIEAIAHELALRFRILARALDRLDRLEEERDFAGWLRRLAADQDVLTKLSTTLVLHALQAAVEETPYRLLRLLDTDEAVSLATLCERSGLDRASLYLWLGRLVHAGLVTMELEAESVRSTPLGRVLISWLTAVIAETRGRITEWLTLMGSVTP